MEKLTEIIKKSLPAVVSIIATKSLRELEKELPAEVFPFLPFGMPDLNIPEEKVDAKGMVEIGSGSGFIVEHNGLILTNKHVISDPEAEYQVITNNNKKYRAEVLSRDPIDDIAILKIPATKLPVLKLGNSHNAELGQSVLAIGNALGMFKNSVSQGIISGLARNISPRQENENALLQQLRGLIQTDAAINPGNSGGPLLNMKGEVVGINAAIISGAQNIGFAIPINIAKRDLEDIKNFGKVKRPFLGLRYINIDKNLKEKMGLPVDYGALVIGRKNIYKAIIKDSPADKAGLKENDIILECNGEKISNEKTIQDFLEELNVGDIMKIKVARKDEKINLQVKLAEKK